jgi:uncharacterized protein (TIGR03437 family)
MNVIADVRARFCQSRPFILLACVVLGVKCGSAQIGTWEARAPFPILATEVSAAAIDDRVYVVGGYLENGSSNRLFIYDPFTDTWSEGAPLPIAGGVDHANVAALDGKLYFLGGIRIGEGFTTGRTFEYDPALNTWNERAPMPNPRGASGVAPLGGRIYVAGGLAGGASVRDLEAFDPAANSWTVLAAMPTARDHLTAQAVAGRFYAISGRRDGEVLHANEEYNPATGTWTARAPIPTARGGIGSGSMGGRIQVIGGEGPSGTPQGTFEQNEEYDPSTNTWRTLAPLPTPRHGIYGATVEGRRLFVPSGGPQAGAFLSTAHEAFYLPPDSPPSVPAGGIVSSATFEAAVAPGSLAALFGATLSPAAQLAVRLPLPEQMNATSVLINGVPAPLLYAGEGQINFHIPTGTQAPATLVVRHAGVESTPQTLPLFPAAPGIFSASQDGRGQGAIVRHGTGALATPDNPATAGEFLEIYCTGLGELAGAPAPEVLIGGQPGEVTFFGEAPGFVGLNQINVRLPGGLAPGNALPVRIIHRGRTSNEVTIAVR